MELTIIKSRPISIILLLLLLLSVPCFSTGSLDVSNKEVYENDYPNPKTHHPIIPSPDHYPDHSHWIHRETDLPPHKSSKGGMRGGQENS
ncbi:hypothetical protein CRYUN_Cryun08bG0144800 [Craigia yunnanensis]